MLRTQLLIRRNIMHRTNIHNVEKIYTNIREEVRDNGKVYYVRHVEIKTKNNGRIEFTLFSDDRASLVTQPFSWKKQISSVPCPRITDRGFFCARRLCMTLVASACYPSVLPLHDNNRNELGWCWKIVVHLWDILYNKGSINNQEKSKWQNN